MTDPMPEWFKTVRPYTMLPDTRLDHVFKLMLEVEHNDMPGDFVECGCWKGGCVGVAAEVIKRFGYRRKAHGFDSFQGLPQARDIDGEDAKKRTGDLAVSREHIDNLMLEMGIKSDAVVVHEGWFDDTLNDDHGIESICMLRLDCDWYDSVLTCLDHLYDLVVPDGYIIIDDFGKWPGCQQAVIDFIEKRKLEPPYLWAVDGSCVWWEKSLSPWCGRR